LDESIFILSSLNESIFILSSKDESNFNRALDRAYFHIRGERWRLRSASSLTPSEQKKKKSNHDPLTLLQQQVSFLGAGACWFHQLHYRTQQKENEP
jgi:hypothetical protein